MQITFTRTGDGTYATSALREDGVLLQVPSYDRKFSLPHDLAHFVVEHELKLKYGFWGCVAAGALFSGIKVVSGRQKHNAAERSKAILREARQRGAEAELIVSAMLKMMHEGSEANWRNSLAMSAGIHDASRPPQEHLGASEVRRVCKLLREFEERWQALAIGESLSVLWSHDKTNKR